MAEVPNEASQPAAVAWRVLAATAPQRSVAGLVGSGILLGLPIARLPEAPIEPPSGLAGLPVRADRRPSSSASAAPRELADVLVVDLGSLWAGPLCGALLADRPDLAGQADFAEQHRDRKSVVTGKRV